jgi:hypothetical protein
MPLPLAPSPPTVVQCAPTKSPGGVSSTPRLDPGDFTTQAITAYTNPRLGANVPGRVSLG